MAWIRNAQKVATKGHVDSNLMDYEIGSECRITGLLNYPDGALLFSPLTFGKDDRGLYRYTLRVFSSLYDEADRKEWEKADSEGYCFPGGFAQELMALASVHHRSRFYLLSSTNGQLTERAVGIKNLNSFTYIKCNPQIHKAIFDETTARNWTGDFQSFLEEVRRLPENLHRRFALACGHYLDALKEVGISEEMVFIRLVSAMECLMPEASELPNDPFEAIPLSSFCNLEILKEPARASIKSWYQKQRHVSKRFIYFMKEGSRGYLPANGKENIKITMENIEPFLSAIYTARSEYLHAGKSMYLSNLWTTDSTWDYEPSYGKTMDQQHWTAEERLPYPYFFEGLVRHCILKYLHDNAAPLTSSPS